MSVLDLGRGRNMGPWAERAGARLGLEVGGENVYQCHFISNLSRVWGGLVSSGHLGA